ncbi:MAG TPA: ABC transporter permease [Vicinamibacterales bacterium]|nr:ABC transporter permease [Vicinamibacterales bacterium]
MDELRLSLRRLTKRPASTLASIATLGFAIGAAAVTWSALSAVLINPLPVHEPERLLVLGTRVLRGPALVLRTGFLYPKYREVQASGAFERTVAQWSSPHTLLVTVGDTPQRADVGFATHDFFDVLGVPASVGREFTAEDDQRGAAPVAVLGDRYWRRAFNADSSVIGRTIVVAGKPVAVVGVLARGFRGLDLSESLDIYLPFHTIADINSPDTNYFAEKGARSSPTAGTMILGRLRPGTSASEALARVTALEPPPPPGRAAPQTVLVDVNTAAVPEIARTGMIRFARLLAATVGLLLFIGCTTVGMLLLIRTEARSGEFAMCMALGASRGRLGRGIATEGALLAAGGAGLAIPVAWWLFRLIQVFQLPGNVSIDLLELSLDWGLLTVTIAAAAVAVLLIGLVAAVFGFRATVADALRSRTGATPRVTRRITRAGLLGAQVAVAMTLVAGAGLFARSLMAALNLNQGLDMSRLVIGTLELRSHGYPAERATEFFDALRDRLRDNPSLHSVAFTTYAGGMTSSGKLQVDGLPRQFPSTVWYTRVDREYFRTMGIKLLEGRDFTVDDRATTPPVAIVSRSSARLLAEGGTALGRRVGGLSAADAPVRIVGVASDVVANVNVLEPLMIYLPEAQARPMPYRDLTARAASSADDARREILAAVKQLDPLVTPTPLRTLEERVLAQMEPQKFGVTVLSSLGGLAILLTLLGTYVLADSMTTMRMREMGIRAALGASRRQLGAIVLGETARLIGLGLAAGLGLAWLGASMIRGFLFQVQPLDPVTLGGVAALIMLLALAVTLRAALRAARVDLSTVLKSE